MSMAQRKGQLPPNGNSKGNGGASGTTSKRTTGQGNFKEIGSSANSKDPPAKQKTRLKNSRRSVLRLIKPEERDQKLP